MELMIIPPQKSHMRLTAVIACTLCCIASFAQNKYILRDTIDPKVYVLETSKKTASDKISSEKQLFNGSSAVLGWQRFALSTLVAKADIKKKYTPGMQKERFLIVKKGPLTFSMNGQSKTMDRGSVVLVLPGDELTILNAGTETAEYYEMEYDSRQPTDMDRAKAAGPSFMMDWKDMVFKPHDKGGVRQLFDRKTAMFNRFDIHVTQLNEGNKSHDPHQHKNEEIILMLEGNAEMQIGTDHQKANPGDVVFLTSNVLHNLSNIGKGACLYFAIQWN
jgi:(S)-ureidoglycine aminohydrolase